MIRSIRNFAQVVALPCVLVFGGLVMVGSFEVPVWSHPATIHEETVTTHDTYFWFIYSGKTETRYYYEHSSH